MNEHEDQSHQLIKDVVEHPRRDDRPVDFSQQVMQRVAAEPRSLPEKDVGLMAIIPCLCVLVITAIIIDYLFLGGLDVQTEMNSLSLETFEWPLFEIGALFVAVPLMYFLLLGKESAEERV